jgi:hypothetical protein
MFVLGQQQQQQQQGCRHAYVHESKQGHRISTAPTNCAASADKQHANP